MHALALAAAANVLIVLYTPLPSFPASHLGNLALLDYPTASIYYFYPIVLSQFALAQSARANVKWPDMPETPPLHMHAQDKAIPSETLHILSHVIIPTFLYTATDEMSVTRVTGPRLRISQKYARHARFMQFR